MVILQPNTDSQRFYLTLDEARKFLPSFSEYLVELEHQGTHEKWFFIATIATENERYTEIAIDTDDDDPTQGNIVLDESGYYFYKVYGQNSTTNLDPNNTVGIVEYGILQVGTDVNYYVPPTITTPNAIIYNG